MTSLCVIYTVRDPVLDGELSKLEITFEKFSLKTHFASTMKALKSETNNI